MLTWSLEPLQAHSDRSFVPVGAHATGEGVVYRVWAPDHASVRVVTGGAREDTRYVPLERDTDGFFTGRDERGEPGDRYWFQLGEHDAPLLPDPASRFQPDGVQGPSQVIEPRGFRWRTEWQRPPLRGRVIYELHMGTFTADGTFRAAMERLDDLADLGVNTLELMPVGDFAGSRNWGYDGVMIFAPARCYGTPDDLRALIDAAHGRGLAVVLDVVYNHLGPVGNVLPSLSRHYFHPSHSSTWGTGLNFDGAYAAPVREFFLQNACHWLDEYRVDGLRLDAVHAIKDSSQPHLVAEIAAAAHARGAFVIAEDEHNEARIITPFAAGGWGVDGTWSDDFHHSARVGLTGERRGYYANYRGTIAEWVDTLRGGWLYRGQPYPTWGRPRGSDPLACAPEQFVVCISNHDQVGNRPAGDRLNHAVSPEAYRAISMVLCLVPHTPLLFMGQEWGATAPFPFFSDLPGEAGATIRENRIREFRLHHAHYDAAILARMPDPQAEATFRSAKLDWTERARSPHRELLALYRACLRLRADHPIFQSASRDRWRVEYLGDETMALRWHDPAGDWLLLAGLSGGMHGRSRHAFVQPSAGRGWERVLASNEPRFGGAAEPPDRGPVAYRAPGAVLWRER